MTPATGKTDENSDRILREINRLANPMHLPVITVASKLDLYNASAVPNCVDYGLVQHMIQESGLTERLGDWIFTHNVGREDAVVRASATPESLGFETANYNVLAQVCTGLYLYSDEVAAEEYLESLQKAAAESDAKPKEEL